MGYSNEHFDFNALLDLVLKRLDVSDTPSKAKVEEAYRNVVGDLISRLTWAVKYEPSKRILKVSLASPALKRELSFKVGDLIKAINDYVGSPAVNQIVFL